MDRQKQRFNVPVEEADHIRCALFRNAKEIVRGMERDSFLSLNKSQIKKICDRADLAVRSMVTFKCRTAEINKITERIAWVRKRIEPIIG